MIFGWLSIAMIVIFFLLLIGLLTHLNLKEKEYERKYGDSWKYGK